MENNKKENSENKKIINLKKLRKNPWIISTIVLGIAIFILSLTSITGHGKVISSEQAGENLVLLAKEQIGDIKVLNVEKENGLYNIYYSSSQGNGSIYMTLDGKNLASLMAIDLPDSSENQQTETNTPKSNKPQVELFVMSYCPYGTQAEKGIIPVVELLKDKIDFRIRFVNYLMHGEKEGKENLREYCIQEIAPEKYLDYMTCFLEGDGVESNGYITNGNDINTCLNEAEINRWGEVAGRMAVQDEVYSIVAEVAAVNRKNLEVAFSGPKEWFHLERIAVDLAKQRFVFFKIFLIIENSLIALFFPT
ncbi:MAG: hypothetical protein P8X70_00310 [Nanoarchaeota archaeon]